MDGEQAGFSSRCVQDEQGLCIFVKDPNGAWKVWAHLVFPQGIDPSDPFPFSAPNTACPASTSAVIDLCIWLHVKFHKTLSLHVLQKCFCIWWLSVCCKLYCMHATAASLRLLFDHIHIRLALHQLLHKTHLRKYGSSCRSGTRPSAAGH